MKSEKDPSGLTTGQAGAKFDVGKPPIMRGALFYFPRALAEISIVSGYGAQKYIWNGWETVPDGVTRYSDAMGRHLIGECVDGHFDPDTNLLHMSQTGWNSLARLELFLRENPGIRSNPKPYEKKK